MDLLRRINRIIWLVAITVAPLVPLAIYGWAMWHLLTLPFPGGRDGRAFVLIFGFVAAMFPFLAPLPKHGDVSLLEKHHFRLGLSRQLEKGFLGLMVMVLTIDRILAPMLYLTTSAILAGIFSCWAVVALVRLIEVALYVWCYARSEYELEQYVQEHIYR